MKINLREEYRKKFRLDIKNFKIIHQLKSDIYSSIYSVCNIHTNKKYAAKVIISENEIKYKQNFNQIIDILIRIHHPTIIKFYGFSLFDFSSENNVTIFTKIYKNGSLSTFLEKSRNSSHETICDNTTRQIILVGIARGMMYLHKNHKIHGNLTPNNVLLDDYFYPHISDFYGSKNRSEPNITKYNAPEVISGHRYNGKADVYSFGILMFEIVTNSIAYPLFESGEMSLSDFKDNIVDKNIRPTFTTTVKAPLKKLIEKCWSKDPNERPTFECLFKKLSFNGTDSVYGNDEDEEEDEYHLDDVDVSELRFYVDEIFDDSSEKNVTTDLSDASQIEEKNRVIEELEKKIYELEEENLQLKNQIDDFQIINGQFIEKLEIVTKKLESYENRFSYTDSLTINIFNSLSLKSQRIILSKIIQNSPNISPNSNIVNIRNLLLYMERFCENSNIFNFFEMISNNSESLFNDIYEEKQDMYQSYFIINATEMPKCIQSLVNPDFVPFLNKFEYFHIKLNYPSKSFDKLYSIISYLMHFDYSKITLSVLIKNVNEIGIDLQNKTLIESIIIDSSVSSILSSAFLGCTSLTKVSIPSSIKSIESHVFEGCTSLPQIVIPKSVTSIKSHAFSGCSSLKKIYFQNSTSSLTDIGEGAFFECVSLDNIVLPDSVVFIESSAFEGCQSITSIPFPSGLQSIGNNVFCGCQSITQISIPLTITVIPNRAFFQCKSIVLVNMYESVTKVGDYAFGGCQSLRSIVIPDSVTTIGRSAFCDCSSLEEIKLSSALTIIRYKTFSGCRSLKTISIPESVKTIGRTAFENCVSLVNALIPSKYIIIEDQAFIGCKSLKSASIPFYTRSISRYAFPSLTRIDKI